MLRFTPTGLLALGLLLVWPTIPRAADLALPGERGLLKLAGHHVKWGAPAYGSPAGITYAYLREPRSFFAFSGMTSRSNSGCRSRSLNRFTTAGIGWAAPRS